MFSPPKPASFEEQTGALTAVPLADEPARDQAPPQPLPKFAAFHLPLHQLGWPTVQPQTTYSSKVCIFWTQNKVISKEFLTRSETLPLG